MMIVEQMLKNAPNPLLHIADVSGSALFQGDCLDIMPLMPDKSVQLILTDIPYGTTSCKWDEIIPFDLMWENLNRVANENTAIILFGSEPFTTKLRMSNLGYWKYDFIWHKNQPSGQMNAKNMPMKAYETISVFYKKQPIYNPQMVERTEKELKRLSHKSFEGTSENTVYGDINRKSLNRYEHLLKYPTNVINDIKCVFNRSGEKVNHPTQKPVELMKYLIKTYSTENDMVLDFTMGSGTTCLASKELNRKFIGIEKEAKYYKIACQRCGF